MSRLVFFFFILFLHLLFDMHLQSGAVYTGMKKRFLFLLMHTLTWALGVWFAGYFLMGFTALHFAILFFSHGISDYWKTRQPHDDKHFYCTYIDQGVHLLSLVIVTLI